jgi:tripartite-type tricarboxylate transporter receptor subunit TctC
MNTSLQDRFPTRRTCLAWAVGAGLAPLAHSQSAGWPSRPVRVVVPSPPGGPSDVFARLVTEQMSKTFGQPFVVDNKAGANGMIGNDMVAKASPDGQTLLFTYAAAVAINHALLPKMPYDALKDLQPIAQIGASGTLLVVTADFPANNVREFVEHVRANPDKYDYASWGQGSGGHLSMEALNTQAGLKIRHVPYRGIPQILTDLQGGVIKVAFVDAFTSLPHIRSGKIKPIVLSGTRRGPALPEVPTLSEAGYKFDVDAWFGLFAPSGTPAAVVRRLNEETNRILLMPEIRSRFTALNMPDAPIKTVDQFAQTVRDDIQAWSGVIKAANVKPE